MLEGILYYTILKIFLLSNRYIVYSYITLPIPYAQLRYIMAVIKELRYLSKDQWILLKHMDIMLITT